MMSAWSQVCGSPCASCSDRAVRDAGRWPQRGAAPAGRRRHRPRARARADRSHRLLGVDRQRRLALAHGDAAEGRLCQRAAQRRKERRSPTRGTPAKDGSCEAYGAAGLMRMPTRLHITWQDDNTLKIETDAGQQTRRLLFDRHAPAPAAEDAAGLLAGEVGTPAAWRPGRWWAVRAAGARPASGNLKVVTTNLSGGWLRRTACPTATAPRSPSTSIASRRRRRRVARRDDPRERLASTSTRNSSPARTFGAKWTPRSGTLLRARRTG